MALEVLPSDAELLDILRTGGSADVSHLAERLKVTQTAVRQRIVRLMRQGLIEREAVRKGRGRPHHVYQLTDQGLRATGSNFTDLAQALWQQIGQVDDPLVRKELIRRIAHAMATTYADQVHGQTAAERIRSLVELFAQWRVPASVEDGAELPVLTAHACPYPQLAEQDPTVCEMEELLFSELVGDDVELSQCRREGGRECSFRARSSSGSKDGERS